MMYASAKRAHLWNCHFTVKNPFHNWPMTAFLYPCPAALSAAPCVPSMCVCRVFLSQLFQKQQLCVQQSRAASHSFEQKVAPSLTRVVPYRQPTRSCGQCSHSHSHKHIWTKNWQKENQNTIDWLIPENGDLFSDQKIPVHVICTICWYDVADGELCLPHTCGHPWTTRQLFIQLISVLTIALGNKRKNTSNQQKVSHFNQKED